MQKLLRFLASLRGERHRPFRPREIEEAFRYIDSLGDAHLRFGDGAGDAGPVFYIAEAFAWDTPTAARMLDLWRAAHGGTASFEERCRLAALLQRGAARRGAAVSA